MNKKKNSSPRTRRSRKGAKRGRASAPIRVGEILEQLKRDTSLGEHLEQARIWQEWPAVAGPHLYEHGRPVTVKENTLYIEADSPVWMHKFAYYKWDIIKRINRLARRELISDIFIQLTPDHGPTSMAPENGA